MTGPALAAELGISLRSVYRDIATLQAQGARIGGAAGLGYILRPGFMLPPLMFSEEEIEALALGSRWVADRTDHALAEAARSAPAKIAAVLPKALRDDLDASALLVGSGGGNAGLAVDMGLIRQAFRNFRTDRILALEPSETRYPRKRQVLLTNWPLANKVSKHQGQAGAWVSPGKL